MNEENYNYIVGKTLRNKTTGESYTVESAHIKTSAKGGRYVMLLTESLKTTGSHGVIYWKNIDCADDFVKEPIRKQAKEYEAIE